MKLISQIITMFPCIY